MVDTKTIELVKKGKHSAFKSMYESCVPYVYSIVVRYVSNQSEYADVVQEIFARLFLSVKTFDPSRGQFRPWLRRLVINECIQHYRKKKSTAPVLPLDNADMVEDDFEFRINEITKEEMQVLLSGMPEGYRQVFMMIVIDEYTHKEVSQLLEISIDTSRSQLSRGKRWLRKNLFNSSNKICG